VFSCQTLWRFSLAYIATATTLGVGRCEIDAQIAALGEWWGTALQSSS